MASNQTSRRAFIEEIGKLAQQFRKDAIQELFEEESRTYYDTVSLGVQLTTRCLNDCSYCGADRHDRTEEVDFDVLKGHITRYNDFAEATGKKLTVGLDGADNFLYTHFDEFIQWLFDNGINYFIKCNASTLTEARIDRLIETNCDYVRLTVLGEADVHDTLRGLDTYEIVCRKTRFATRKGLDVMWNLTVGAHNITSICRVLEDIPYMGLVGIMENRMYRAGKANDEAFEELSPKEWRMFLQIMLNKWITWGDMFPIVFRDTLWVPFLAEEGLLDVSKFERQEIQGGCGLGAYYACVDTDGHIKGCLTLEAAAKETATNESIIKFYPSKTSKLYFTKDTEFSPQTYCQWCEYYRFCRGCAAVTLANTGDKNAQDPQCWVGR